jgi:DNA modification methylase
MSNLNQLNLHDARLLNQLFPTDEAVITTTITSPPYWKLKDYGAEGQIGFGQSKKDYLRDLELVFTKSYKYTKGNGSLWVVVDDYREDGVLQLLPWEVAQCAQNAGWILRDIIIWDKQHTLPWHMKGQMRNVVEYVLFFSRSETYKFYVDRIKDWEELSQWWVDFPERFSPKGKTPTNIWSIPIRTQGTWRRLSEMNHHCPFPTELVARIIELTTDPGDLVFDPFSGSGVVLAQAAAMDRAFIGCDINPAFIKMFNKYIMGEVATEWEKLKKVKEHLSKAEGDFERLIMKLRALKFARQVTKPFIELWKEKPTLRPIAVLCLASVPQRYERKKPFDVKVHVAVDQINEDFNKALQTAIDRASKKPLTLYQIQPEITLISRADLLRQQDLLRKRFHLYTDYKPRKHSGEALLSSWFKDERIINADVKAKVPMLANLAVDVAWVLD